MSRTRFPEQRDWAGVFSGSVFGHILVSKNIDLERSKGQLVLGDSLSDIFDDGDDAQLTLPVAFLKTAADGTNRWWANAGKLFKTSGTDPESGWAQDALTNSPTAPQDDLIEFLGDLYVPTDTDVDQLSGGTWTNSWWSGKSSASALQSGVPHPLAIFAGAMLIGDGRFINTWDGTLENDPDLTLPQNREIQFFLTTSKFVFAVCNSTDNTETEAFAWDRTSDTFNERYALGDETVLCGFVVRGVPHIVNKRGQIRRFTGNGFRTVQSFPSDEAFVDLEKIHPNGVTIEGDIVKLNVDFGSSDIFKGLSGIWTFDSQAESLNLYHSHSVTNGSGSDYSQQEVDDVGALRRTEPSKGRYLIGASAYTDYPGSTVKAIYSSDEGSTSGQRGYLITTQIPAGNARRFWRSLILNLEKMKNSGDRMRVAYRVDEDPNLPAYETVTWASSTTFTASNSNIAVGDFVDVLAGDNAGAIAKITDITGSTVTIDKTLNSSSKDARVRYLRFTDAGELTDQETQSAIFRTVGRSPWLQLLIELEGTVESPAFNDMLIDYDDVPL